MHEPIAFPWQLGGGLQMKPDTNLCGSLVKNQTHAVAHSLSADGFDASEDGTGRGTPLVPVGVDGGETGFALRAGASHSGDKGDGGVNTTLAVNPGMAVRRLTPRECEKLQGFTTVTERVVFDLCLDHQKNAVLAGLKCRRWLNSVSIAGDAEKPANASSADMHFVSDPESLAAVAHIHVRLSHAPTLHAIHSLGKLLWCANGAEGLKMSLRSLEQESIARVIVAAQQGAAILTKTGRVELQQSTTHFILPRNGNWSAAIFGRENVVCASGAEADQNAATTFTTSSQGLLTQNSEQARITWLCSALSAIASFTPERISSESTARLVIDVESDWTLIPWRKATAENCPDGPRYKALGNSMAVPVMRWIGERIATVDQIP